MNRATTRRVPAAGVLVSSMSMALSTMLRIVRNWLLRLPIFLIWSSSEIGGEPGKAGKEQHDRTR